jgi:hypothetical protein
MNEEENQQKHAIFIIESKIPDDIITDDELIYKLKEILKKVTLSSFSLKYRAILSDDAFETLFKLKSYENSLNCKLHNCLHEVTDIDNYILNKIDKNEIRNIISQMHVPTSDNNDDNFEPYFKEYNRKPSSFDIKSNPYCNSFVIEPGEITEISRFRSSNNPAVLSYTTNTSSMNSSHSIGSNNYLNADNNNKFLKDRSSLFLTRSISCVNQTSQTNLTPSTSKTAISLGKRQFSLFNLNYYQSRRVTPIPVKSSSVFSASDELDIHAQACIRLVLTTQ